MSTCINWENLSLDIYQYLGNGGRAVQYLKAREWNTDLYWTHQQYRPVRKISLEDTYKLLLKQCSQQKPVQVNNNLNMGGGGITLMFPGLDERYLHGWICKHKYTSTINFN